MVIVLMVSVVILLVPEAPAKDVIVILMPVPEPAAILVPEIRIVSVAPPVVILEIAAALVMPVATIPLEMEIVMPVKLALESLLVVA